MHTRTDYQVAFKFRGSQSRLAAVFRHPVWSHMSEGLKLIALTAAISTMLITAELITTPGVGQ